MTDWQLTIITGNSTDAGTNGTVYLTLEGTKGTWDLDIMSGGKLFQRNQVDVFSWLMPDIGALKQVELIHVEFILHHYQNWWLKSMVLLDTSAAVEYLFNFNGYIPENQFHYGEVTLVPDFELEVNLTELTTTATMASATTTTMASATITTMATLSNFDSFSPSSSVHQSEYFTFSNVHGSVRRSQPESSLHISSTSQQFVSVSNVDDYQTSSNPPNHQNPIEDNTINTSFTTRIISTIANQTSYSTIYDYLSSRTSPLPSSILETSRNFVSTNIQTATFPDEFLLTSSPYFLTEALSNVFSSQTTSKVNSGSLQPLSMFSIHKTKLNVSGTSPASFSSAMLFSHSKNLNIEISEEITITDFSPDTSQGPSQVGTQDFLRSFFSTSSLSSSSSHFSTFRHATTHFASRDATSFLLSQQMMSCVYSFCGQHSALLSSFFNQNGAERDTIDESVTLQIRLVNISKDLTVDKKDLSKYKRAKSSAVDDRYSATAIGYFAVTTMLIPLALVVASDLMNYQKFFPYSKNRKRLTAPKPLSI